MLLIIPFGLLGDYIGTIPVTIELSRRCKRLNDILFVLMHYDARPIFEMIPKQYDNIRHADWQGEGHAHVDIRQIDLPKIANTVGMQRYMTAAYFHSVGLPVPHLIDPRPELELDPEWNRAGGNWHNTIPDFFCGHFDYGLAPFARSLGEHEKWPRERWQQLVDSMPDYRFVLYGHDRDDHEFVTGPNVVPMFGQSLHAVCWSMKSLTQGLLSVSTGLSHFAYALEVTNYLLINQGPFARNPAAKTILAEPARLTLEQVQELIRA